MIHKFGLNKFNFIEIHLIHFLNPSTQINLHNYYPSIGQSDFHEGKRTNFLFKSIASR